MTPEQQRILEMRDNGMSRNEIAKALGLSNKAVKGRLERARAGAKA